jgi:hypothetical protein
MTHNFCYSSFVFNSDILNIDIYSKPSLIRLQLFRIIWIEILNMKNAVHSWVHNFKTHTALVRSDKTWQSLETCIITFKNKRSFWVFYRRINVVPLSHILLFIFIGTTYIIKFSIYLCSKPFLSLIRATFCFTNPDYGLIRMIGGGARPPHHRAATVSIVLQ